MKATDRFRRYLVAPFVFAGMLDISSAAELNPAGPATSTAAKEK